MGLAALATNTSQLGKLNSMYGAGASAPIASPVPPPLPLPGDAVPIGGTSFPRAVQHTLNALGIAPQPGVAPTPTPTLNNVSAAAYSRPPEKAEQNVGQDTHQLMHDLYQAIHQEQVALAHGGTDRTNATAADGYSGSLTAGLQSLIQKVEAEAAVAGGTSSTTTSKTAGTNSLLAKVRADYRRLLSDLGGSTVSSASNGKAAQRPDLQTFLHSLVANLHDQVAAGSGVGGLISISA